MDGEKQAWAFKEYIIHLFHYCLIAICITFCVFSSYLLLSSSTFAMLGHACVHPHCLLSPATSQLSSESLACSLMKQKQLLADSCSQTRACNMDKTRSLLHWTCALVIRGRDKRSLSLSLSCCREREDRLWKWKRGFFSPPPTQAAELRGAPSLRGSLIFESQNTCCCLPLDRQEAGGCWAEVGWGWRWWGTAVTQPRLWGVTASGRYRGVSRLRRPL